MRREILVAALLLAGCAPRHSPPFGAMYARDWGVWTDRYADEEKWLVRGHQYENADEICAIEHKGTIATHPVRVEIFGEGAEHGADARHNFPGDVLTAFDCVRREQVKAAP